MQKGIDKMFTRFFKGENECPFQYGTDEYVFWNAERMFSAKSDKEKERLFSDFVSCLQGNELWPEDCNDEEKDVGDRAALFWIAADFAMHAPMAYEST